MTDDLARPAPGILDEVDPASQRVAADQQTAERDRDEGETRRRFGGDPGDPRDRIDGASEDRLLQQREARS